MVVALTGLPDRILLSIMGSVGQKLLVLTGSTERTLLSKMGLP